MSTLTYDHIQLRIHLHIDVLKVLAETTCLGSERLLWIISNAAKSIAFDHFVNELFHCA